MIFIIKHVEVEGPGHIADFFANTAWQTKLVDVNSGGVLPKEIEDIEAVILLGGPMNVYEEDKHPFLGAENEFIKKVLILRIPLLGICLGAQIIAKVANAQVTKALRPEIGWDRVFLTDAGMQDPLFCGLGPNLEIFQWHQDAFKIPREAELLAQSSVCAQAFRLGENAYGLQFHFEVTPRMVESWLDYYSGDGELTDEVMKKNMVLEAYKKKNDFYKQSQRLLFNFSRIIETR